MKNSTTVNQFLAYAEMFNQDMWTGMRVVEKALNNQVFDSTDTDINIPHRMHKKLIEDYLFWNMYSKYSPILGPGGAYCLEGTYTTTIDETLISAPFECPGGSYGLPGSATAIGTGFCPAGFYCPPGSENAIPTDPGYFTPTDGAISQIPGYPGFFTLSYQSTSCSRCPNGFQCKGTGTSWPTIGPVGYFRSSSGSNAGSLCPAGTFSIERGIRDETECLSCPEGRIGSEKGLTNVTNSNPGSDGAICNQATGARSTITCPEGFYCPSSTGVSQTYSNTGPPGFYGSSGTGDGSKYNKKCPRGYYCPAATQEYPEFIDETLTTYSSPTRGPRGTRDDAEDGKRELTEGIVDSVNTLLVSGDIRQEETTDTNTTSTLRNLQSSEWFAENERGRRNLQTTSTTKTVAERLQDPTEIEMSLHNYIESEGATTDELTSSINLSREYLTRWNPINGSLNNETIFEIPALSYALVTIDLRALQDEYRNFTYYEDWAISFTVDDDITESSRAQPVEMPEMFLRTTNSKNTVLEFQVFAWKEKKMRIDILLYNGLYFNLKYLFLNSGVVQIRSPNRAEFGTEKTFVAILKDEYSIGLPINAPKLQQIETESLPEYSVTFASNTDFTIAKGTQNRVETSRGKNIFVPSSVYWQGREEINLPYFPFFSNCKGYGQYIPIWALSEQHHECVLVDKDETVYMHEYSFRQAPIADSCEEINIEGVYDEVWSDDQQSLTRWFEIGAEESLFDFSVMPVPAEEVAEKEFSANDVLSLAPEGASGDLNTGKIDKIKDHLWLFSKNLEA